MSHASTPPHLRSLADAEPAVYWLADPAAPERLSTLTGEIEADLVVIGGGYTGLWTALQAKEDDPTRDVVLLEANVIGGAASGRNGGFCSASLTHGEANGIERFGDEFSTLQRLGQENLEAIESTLQRYGIDAEWERTGELDIAVEPWQVRGLHELADLLSEHAPRPEVIGRDEIQSLVHSPTYLAAVHDPEGVAMVHPTKLAWGLRQACLDLGVRIYEHTEVTDLDGGSRLPTTTRSRSTAPLTVRSAYGAVRAPQVALATNSSTGLLRRLNNYVAPVYDYVLMTEPLSQDQLASIGWEGRQGLADAGNQFHYYRLTADNRILWGGWDVIYHFGGKVSAEYDHRAASYELLAQHFFTTFPQLLGLRFTHRWGGAIDTCSRFTTFWGQAYGGRLSYALGYTGLGVGASRFGARVMLDLLSGEENERTRLKMVRTKPLPFPPEPARYGAIALTTWSIDRADRHGGKRNPWLRTLDALGLGFDS
ncbi:MAG: FAD-dependent oxidoreductase [Ornithinimicrobium sp.]